MPKIYDWTQVEVDVRVGKLNLKEIAAKHGVSYSGLRKKVNERGWTPDLTVAVQAATRTELAKQAQKRLVVTKPLTPEDEKLVAAQVAAEVERDARMADSAIDAAVLENVAVINRHRAIAGTLMKLTGQLAQEVKTLTEGEKDPFKRQLTLGDRVDAARKLSQTVATIVDIERKAHNLDAASPSDDTVVELVRSLQGSTLPVIQKDPEQDDR
jgi:hypothetical protein